MNDDRPVPPARGLASIAFAATCVGWVLVPVAGPLGLLVVAWGCFVALAIIFTGLRDGRRVARIAYATLVVAVLGAGLLRGSP